MKKELKLEKMLEVISKGDDRYENKLILTKDGEFLLISPNQYMFFSNTAGIVWDHETFQAGNEYVGEEAAKDIGYFKPIFDDAIKDWNEFIRVGETWNEIVQEVFDNVKK